MNLLAVKNLHVSYTTYAKTIYAVRGASFHIDQGEVLGIVGESGSGKSAAAKAIMRLLPTENASIDEGQILFENHNLLHLPEKAMRKIRGNDISMIFQDPLSSLNPTMTIGNQIGEVIRHHNKSIKRKDLKMLIIDLLASVGIKDPDLRIHQYPHELSGGQRQRVMIAISLACNPKLLIADEPTTALDVTIQAQILDELKKLKNKTSIILITHDLSLVAGFCDRIIVMYAGEIVEEAMTEELFKNPKHPYTKRLLQSLPRPGLKKLKTIPGHPPSLSKLKTRCSFCPRCKHAMNICALKQPPSFNLKEDHHAACWLYDPAYRDQKTQEVLLAEK